MRETRGSDATDERALLRGLTERRLSRRGLLRGAGGALAGAYLAGALSACGIAGTRDTGAPAASTGTRSGPSRR